MKNVIIAVLIIFGLFFGILVISQQQSKNTSQTSLSTIPSGTAPSNQTPPPDTLSPSVSPSTTIPPEFKNVKKATIKTSKGDIILTLYPEEAPNTVGNFAKKASDGYYKNLTFHRVEDWVIQGGDPKGDGTGGGDIPVEFNSKPFIVGSLGVASLGDGKIQNDSQFFITKKESPHLNSKYTNFGIVTEGMDVVEKIAIGDKILEIIIEQN